MAPSGADLGALQLGTILEIDRFFTQGSMVSPAELTNWAVLLDDLIAHHRDSAALAHLLLERIGTAYLGLAARAPQLVGAFARRRAIQPPPGAAWTAELFEIRLGNAALDLAETEDHHDLTALLYLAAAGVSALIPGSDDTHVFDYRRNAARHLALSGNCAPAMATWADLPDTRNRRPAANLLSRIPTLRALIDCFDRTDPAQARTLRYELLRLLELGADAAAQVAGGDRLHWHLVRIAEVLIDLGDTARAQALLLEAWDLYRALHDDALAVHDVVARAVLRQLRRAAPEHPAIPRLSLLAGERLRRPPDAAAGSQPVRDTERLARSMNLAQILFMQRRWSEAEAVQRVVIAELRRLPETSGAMGLAVNLDLLAAMVSAQGRFAEAVALRRAAVSRATRGDPDFRGALARDLAASGQRTAAVTLLLQLLDEERARSGADSPALLSTLRGLVGLHDGADGAAGPASALPWRQEIQRILALQADRERSRPEPPSPMSLPQTLLDLADITAELGEADRAAALLVEAVESWRAHHGDANAYTRFTAREAIRRLTVLDPDHPALAGLRQAFPAEAAAGP